MSHRKDTDYLSISARIRAMENRLLTRERMDRMIEARDAGEAMKVLTECGYPDGPSLEAVLAQARADTFRDMEEVFLPEGEEPILEDQKKQMIEGRTIAVFMGKEERSC